MTDSDVAQVRPMPTATTYAVFIAGFGPDTEHIQQFIAVQFHTVQGSNVFFLPVENDFAKGFADAILQAIQKAGVAGLTIASEMPDPNKVKAIEDFKKNLRNGQ